ncbi:DUF1045 domain-containing protein [Tabrizicola sp.]|uniref:DUF1045 domain-containing protein n=1 Tax=Tabrizicola sp. TaxID=2005166 RepID=UPI00286B3B5E|nr:DUF1045 domain-containing protein [Tabrizicola sp.]
MPDITVAPRKYGFHGTIRAPFRLADGLSEQEVRAAVDALATRLQPARCDGLRLDSIEGFLALTLDGCESEVLALAAAVVEGTDSLRAPLTASDRLKRHPELLSSRQAALFERWGYPYVMEEFQFHMTLTSRLQPVEKEVVAATVRHHFAPVLPRPFVIEDLCLFGEDGEGKFHLLHRAALSG